MQSREFYMCSEFNMNSYYRCANATIFRKIINITKINNIKNAVVKNVYTEHKNYEKYNHIVDG